MSERATICACSTRQRGSFTVRCSGGTSLHCRFVKAKNLVVGPVADGVGPHLNSFAERLVEHRQQIVVGPFKKAAGVVVGIFFRQRRAFRTQCAVEADFDRPTGQPLIEGAAGRAVFEQPLSIVAGAE